MLSKAAVITPSIVATTLEFRLSGNTSIADTKL